MAIDPKKLTAYMDDQEPADDDEIVAEYEVEDEAAGDEETSPEDAEFAAFLEMLMENATEIESAAQAAEVLDIADELPDEVADAIMAALESMPPELVAGMVKYLGQMSPDDLHELVETMEESGQIENDGIVVPFLYWASRLAAGEEGAEEMPMEEMEEMEESPEEEMGEEEEYDEEMA
jgi:hypothetical protein